MPITPFKIVKDDGTIDKEEYLRCIKFLEDYTSGRVKVYTGTTWENPLEINEDQTASSLEILNQYLYNDGQPNRLLTPECFNQLKRFFRGAVSGLFRTIIPDTQYLAVSKELLDGPGYRFDVCSETKEPIVFELGHQPYINDEYRTTLSLSSGITQTFLDSTLWQSGTSGTRPDEFNYNTYEYSTGKKAYQRRASYGYPGTLSIFNFLEHKYQQSTHFFYYSCCEDRIVRHGFENYHEDRLNVDVIPTIKTDWVVQCGQQCLGFDLNSYHDIITNHLSHNNHLISPTANPNGYIHPSDFTLTTDFTNLFYKPNFS